MWFLVERFEPAHATTPKQSASYMRHKLAFIYSTSQSMRLTIYKAIEGNGSMGARDAGAGLETWDVECGEVSSAS